MRIPVSALVTFILSAAALAADADWPGWRGPNRDGKSPDTGLLKEWPAAGPQLLWKASGIGTGFSSVAVSGGAVYISGDLGGKLWVSAFGLDGKLRWKVEIDAGWPRDLPGAHATPIVDGGAFYIMSCNGVLQCLDAKTGAKVWKRDMREFGGVFPGYGYSETPLIYGKLAVVTPGGKKFIVALDKTTGKEVWTSTGYTADCQYSSCLAFTLDKTPLIVSGNKGICGVDARTGVALWSNTFSADCPVTCTTPVYADGYVFWANGYGKGGICLKLASAGAGVKATEAWRTNDMVNCHGGSIIEKGYIYGSNESNWVCLDLKTGQKKWSAPADGKDSSLCWADGMLYLYGAGGQAALATCSPAGLAIKGRVTVAGKEASRAHPVVIGGRLYLRYDDNLYCYNVKAK